MDDPVQIAVDLGLFVRRFNSAVSAMPNDANGKALRKHARLLRRDLAGMIDEMTPEQRDDLVLQLDGRASALRSELSALKTIRRAALGEVQSGEDDASGAGEDESAEAESTD